MSKQNKISWKSDFAFIQAQVNKWDPCNLIKLGAPKDEYDSLTFKILSSLKNYKSDGELKDEIIKFFEADFGIPVYNEFNAKERTKLEEEIDQLIRKIKN